MNLYNFQAVPLPIMMSSLTVHLALVYDIQYEVSLWAGPGWNCLKIVEVHFLAKINLGNQCICWFYYKEICYDAWSHERKITKLSEINPHFTCVHYTVKLCHKVNRLLPLKQVFWRYYFITHIINIIIYFNFMRIFHNVVTFTSDKKVKLSVYTTWRLIWEVEL